MMNPSETFWADQTPLILASASATRRRLLESAGIPVDVKRPDVDERRLEDGLAQKGSSAANIALELAGAKAQAVAALHQRRLVVAADQTLSCGDRRFHKPGTPEEAREHLKHLAGRTHELHSGVSVYRQGECLFSHVSSAAMTMRELSDDFLDRYVAIAGDAVLTSVGAYQIEGMGLQLFERVEGDYFTILGLPLLPLLGFLREARALRS